METFANLQISFESWRIWCSFNAVRQNCIQGSKPSLAFRGQNGQSVNIRENAKIAKPDAEGRWLSRPDMFLHPMSDGRVRCWTNPGSITLLYSSLRALSRLLDCVKETPSHSEVLDLIFATGWSIFRPDTLIESRIKSWIRKSTPWGRFGEYLWSFRVFTPVPGKDDRFLP
jgi:hypothetical protein